MSQADEINVHLDGLSDAAFEEGYVWGIFTARNLSMDEALPPEDEIELQRLLRARRDRRKINSA